MKNKQLLIFGAACLLAVAAGSAARAYDSSVAAQKQAEQVAQSSHSNKQKALRNSILLAMHMQGEGELGHTSTPCSAQVKNKVASDDLGIDDMTYRCTITARSGNVYEAEIELLLIAGELFALPAFLTKIDTEEVL